MHSRLNRCNDFNEVFIKILWFLRKDRVFYNLLTKYTRSEPLAKLTFLCILKCYCWLDLCTLQNFENLCTDWASILTRLKTPSEIIFIYFLQQECTITKWGKVHQILYNNLLNINRLPKYLSWVKSHVVKTPWLKYT